MTNLLKEIDEAVKHWELSPSVQNGAVLVCKLNKCRTELSTSSLCNVCAGSPISDKPCICGGSGTIHGECQGLHEEVYRLNTELSNTPTLEEVREQIKRIRLTITPELSRHDMLDNLEQALTDLWGK